MRTKILFSVLAGFMTISVFAQKTELSVAVYSGLASYQGSAATKTSSMHQYYQTTSGAINFNPYGKKPGGSIGVEMKGMVILKPGISFSLRLDYESLASIVKINTIEPSAIIYSQPTSPANGKTVQRIQSFNFYPSLGYRFKQRKIKIDLSAGMVIAMINSSKEKGDAITNDGMLSLHANNETNHPKTDLRPAIETTIHYKRFGLVAGYQWGLKNFAGDYLGSNTQPEAMMRFLKLGLSFRL